MFAAEDAGPEARHRPVPPQRACAHRPACPSADAPDRESAQLLVSHPEQGWSLLCNGVVVFDDTGELLPDGRAVVPHRAVGPQRAR